MTSTSAFDATLAVVASDIEQSNGEVTVMLLRPPGCGHGPASAGQLSVDIWDGDDEDPLQYAFDLALDRTVGPDETWASAARALLAWLHDHGVPSVDPDDGLEARSARTDHQLMVSVTFNAAQWRQDSLTSLTSVG